MSSEGGPRIGAYGLVVRGVAEGAGLLDVPAGAGWPAITVRRRALGDRTVPETQVGDEHADVRLLDGGHIEIDRAGMTAVFHMPVALADAELVHPYLAPVGGVFARWLGREAFHCGAVVVDGRVWGLLGDKEAGKSTLVAWLATQGHDVFTDDLLAVDVTGDGVVAYAGPRFVDLRPGTAGLLGDRVDTLTVRDGERSRMPLGDVPAELPLGGWVLLSEGDEVSCDRVPPAQRLERLTPHRVVRLLPREPVHLLDVAALPTFGLTRPKRWDELDAVVDLLSVTLTGADRPPVPPGGTTGGRAR